MQKEIRYNGHSTTPSDYDSLDGDMSLMLNVIPEDNALRPVPILGPGTPIQLPTGGFPADIEQVYIHKTQSGDIYIILGNQSDTASTFKMYYTPKEKLSTAPEEEQKFNISYTVKHFDSVGNVLLIIDSDNNVHYYFWKNNAYIPLGSTLPELNVYPRLSTQVANLATLTNVFPEIGASNSTISWDNNLELLYSDIVGGKEYAFRDDEKEDIYNSLFSGINKATNCLSKNGFFTAPFFIRFAYRMYDGNHVMHTIPMLCCPNESGAPFILYGPKNDGDNNSEKVFTPYISYSTLSAQLSTPDKDVWGDIITHIDVFVTPPIISYSNDKTTLDKIIKRNSNPYVQQGRGRYSMADYMSGEKKDVYTQVYSNKYLVGQRLKVTGSPDYIVLEFVGVPEKSVPHHDTYFVKTITKNDVPDLPLPTSDNDYRIYEVTSNPDTVIINLDASHHPGATVLCWAYTKSSSTASPVKSGAMVSLRRSDSSSYHDEFLNYNTFYKISEIPLGSANKNDVVPININKNILNNLTAQPTLSDLGQMRSQLKASGTYDYNNRLNLILSGTVAPSCSGIYYQAIYTANSDHRTNYKEAYVKIVDNNQTIYKSISGDERCLQYFCYPHRGAIELIFKDGQGVSRSIPLTPHPFLNLSHAFNGFNQLQSVQSPYPSDDALSRDTSYSSNIIKVSTVNNLFLFSEADTIHLSTGKVLALSSCAQPLSTGQFGQFPLYAFCDNGIWALEVSSDGRLSSRQPITRDVCINPGSITQLDNSVLFFSDRGLMHLSGSTVQCISEGIDKPLFVLDPDNGFTFLKKQLDEDFAIQYIDWKDYVKEAKIFYDYPTQKIILFDPQERGYSYIYSLRSKQWSFIEEKFANIVNDYPTSRILKKHHTGKLWYLYQFIECPNYEYVKGFFLTRPLKLDHADDYKTLTHVIHRGQLPLGEDHIITLLYGSNDLIHWRPIYGSRSHIIRGMRGTPYKYFMLASVFNLSGGESLSGCSITYDLRYTRRPH